MSKGIGAWASLFSQDEKFVVYKYGDYNLNEPEYENVNHIDDGKIIISHECFADDDYSQMICDKRIEIENCSSCWQYSPDNNIDVMAVHILYKLFRQYQEEGKIPEHISYNV